MSSSPPSIAELRAVTQPESLLARPGAEHWAGRLYMRRLSPYVTRVLLATPLTPNVVTALMIPAGLLAALALTVPGLGGAVAAVALAQLQLLLDCCDGEIARWRRALSPAGVYLDGIAHYSTQAALAAALGVRADGGWESLGGWTTAGLFVALLVLLVESETHLVYVARARAGRPAQEEGAEAAVPRPAVLRRLRSAVHLLPFFRAFRAVEATLLALIAAIVDSAAGGLTATRALVLLLIAAGIVAAAGHLVMTLSSDRLR